MWKNRIYFNYKEVIARIGVGHYPEYAHDSGMDVDWFTQILSNLGIEFAVYTLSEFFTDSLINQIVNALMGIVFNRHSEDYLPDAFIEYDALAQTPDISQLDTYSLRRTFTKILNVLNLTIPRYIPLLQQNEIYSTNPVAPVSSETSGSTRFNDTPQDGGDFNNDAHATNVSESSSETAFDTGSIMSKLDELFRNFRSIILEWSNEFDILFLKEEML